MRLTGVNILIENKKTLPHNTVAKQNTKFNYNRFIHLLTKVNDVKDRYELVRNTYVLNYDDLSEVDRLSLDTLLKLEGKLN